MYKKKQTIQLAHSLLHCKKVDLLIKIIPHPTHLPEVGVTVVKCMSTRV